MGVSGFASKVELVVGGRASINAARRVASEPHPKHGLLVDAFKLSESRMANTVADAGGRGRAGVLLDPEFRDAQSRDLLARRGVELVEYGDMPAKNHGKSIVGQRGLVGTVPFTPAAPLRLDFSVLLDRGGTRALRDVFTAAMSLDRGGIRSAAREARREGILLNDPLNGVSHLRSYLDGELKSSSTMLLASKRTDDARSIKAMARAARDGGEVTLITKDITRSAREKLERAGVDVQMMPTLHGNAMVFDGQRAYVGSAYLNARSLGREGRPTREVGVAVDDKRAVRQLEAALGARADGAWAQARDWLDDGIRTIARRAEERIR